MGTKANPSAYDCYANAEPDEEMFVLLARDEQAPSLVETWAAMRSMQIDKGERPETDRAQVREAYDCAAKMKAWRKANRKEDM